MKQYLLLYAACLALMPALATPASASWTVRVLNAAPSQAIGVFGGQQVGSTSILTYDNIAAEPHLYNHAALWTGTPASWMDLNPAGADQSEAYGVSGGQQVGYARMGSVAHAGLWSGTATSWTDIHPAGADESYAYGVSGEQQVGWAYMGIHRHAGLWTGTAESWVDLNPAGADESYASGVADGQQVGEVNGHASLWTGTAGSWVDLNPAGADESYAIGVADGQQVGYSYVFVDDRYHYHAGLWSGTAASWVDLNPSIVFASFANGVYGGQQVGYTQAQAGGVFHASLWTGTAESWVDLHSFLPQGVYSSSIARGIYTSGGSTWVVGSAFNLTTGNEAILWENIVPEPSSLAALALGLVPLAAVGLKTKRHQE